MAKYLVQIIVLGTQAVGKAFAKAVRQEYQASQAAAQARYAGRRTGGGDSKTAAESMRLGMSVEEARQILNVSEDTTPEELKKQYEFLFNINDKSKGGSFYLQSKVYRAKERLDKHVEQKKTSEQQKSSREEEQQQQQETEQRRT